MKLVGVLFVCALGALAGCSHGGTTSATNAADATKSPTSDDDDDGTASSPATSATSAADAGTTTTATPPSSTSDDQACLSCVVTQDPALQAVVDCDNACAQGDELCGAQCLRTTCVGATTSTCLQAFTTCAACAGAAVTKAETALQTCEACYAGLNPKLGAVGQCITNCEDPSSEGCSLQCLANSGCVSDSACRQAAESAPLTCAAQCL